MRSREPIWKDDDASLRTLLPGARPGPGFELPRLLLLALIGPQMVAGQNWDCVACHRKQTPENHAYAFPDLLTFHLAPTSTEQTLVTIHLEYRQRLFQGALYDNPDQSLRHGWSETQQGLAEIKHMADEMRGR